MRIMGQWTKRPQNYCRGCNYSWYPRGKNVSYSCPRCGSQDVETALMAFMRGLAALMAALVAVIQTLFAAVGKLGRWAFGQLIRVRAWWATRNRRAPAPGFRPASRGIGASRLPVKTGSAGGVWARICSSVGRFFGWVASINDDITGASENPHPLGILAKLFVILVFAAVLFAAAVFSFRGLGLLSR